jgi:putative ABC transport system permease protein
VVLDGSQVVLDGSQVVLDGSQVVLDGSQPAGQGGNPPVGSALSVTGAPGAPALVVVGYANSITNTADGWVAPGEIARLRGPGASAGAQMLYRFARSAATPRSATALRPE